MTHRRSRILAAVQETADGLHDADVMSGDSLDQIVDLTHPADGILSPTPDNLRRVRGARSQAAFAAAHPVQLGAQSRVGEYEAGKHRMDRSRWEMILLREGQHPDFSLTPRSKRETNQPTETSQK